MSLEEHGSGTDRARPILARLLRGICPNETLVVVRLDRPSGSLHIVVYQDTITN